MRCLWFSLIIVGLILVLVDRITGTSNYGYNSTRCIEYPSKLITYRPSQAINISISCQSTECPSGSIISREANIKVLLNKTSVTTRYCNRNMSFLVSDFNSFRKSIQLLVNFSVQGNDDMKIITVKKSDYGDRCYQNVDCYGTNQICSSNGICTCPYNFIFVTNLEQCYPAVSRYYGTCKYTEQCRASKSICKDFVCQCPAHHFPDTFFLNCIPDGRSVYGECSTDENCQKRDINTWCINGRCACKTNYNYINNVCRAFGWGISKSCSTDGNCQNSDINSWCINGQCACKTNYYNISGLCRKSGWGISKSCSTDGNCQNSDINSWCINGQCACKTNYYNISGLCRKSVAAGCSRSYSGWSGILIVLIGVFLKA